MHKRSYDSQNEIHAQTLPNSAVSNRPFAIPRSVGAQFHAPPFTSQTSLDIMAGFNNEPALLVRKRQVTAPLHSHLEKKTIQMLMEGSRKLSRSVQPTQTNILGSSTSRTSLSAGTCADCERVVDNVREELAACQRCSVCVCPNCSIKTVYAGGAADTILCLRCT